MKIKTKFIRIMILAVAAAGLSCGCSSPQKAGVNALEKGEYEEAKAQFEELTKSSDKEEAAGGYRGLGMACYEMEDYEGALAAFVQAVDNGIQPSVQLYNLMGICAMQTGDYAAALSYIQSGLALTHTSDGEDKAGTELVKEMRYNEIVCYEQQADWESARQKVTEYLEDYPDDETVQKEAEFLETR